MPTKRPKKAFEAAVTPWEIRAFHGNGNVQKLLRGGYESEADFVTYDRAVCDYVAGFSERHGVLPSDEFLKSRNILINGLYSLSYYLTCDGGDVERFAEDLLAVAARMKSGDAEVFVQSLIDRAFDDKLEAGLAVNYDNGGDPAGGIAKYITKDDITAILKKNMLARVAELRAVPQPAADAAPGKQNG